LSSDSLSAADTDPLARGADKEATRHRNDSANASASWWFIFFAALAVLRARDAA